MKDEKIDDRNLLGCFIGTLVILILAGAVMFLVWTTVSHVM